MLSLLTDLAIIALIAASIIAFIKLVAPADEHMRAVRRRLRDIQERREQFNKPFGDVPSIPNGLER